MKPHYLRCEWCHIDDGYFRITILHYAEATPDQLAMVKGTVLGGGLSHAVIQLVGVSPYEEIIIYDLDGFIEEHGINCVELRQQFRRYRLKELLR